MPPFTGVRDPIPSGSVERSDLVDGLAVGPKVGRAVEVYGVASAVTFGLIEGDWYAIRWDLGGFLDFGPYAAVLPGGLDELIGLTYDPDTGYFACQEDGVWLVEFGVLPVSDATGVMLVGVDEGLLSSGSTPTTSAKGSPMAIAGAPSVRPLSTSATIVNRTGVPGDQVFAMVARTSTTHTAADGATALTAPNGLITRVA